MAGPQISDLPTLLIPDADDYVIVSDRSEVSERFPDGTPKKTPAGNLSLINPPEGFVVGPEGATDHAVARFDGATGQAIANSPVTIDDAGNLATPGTVDGRDVSVDGAALDAHVGSTANPHAVTAVQIGAVPTSREVTTAAPLTGGGPLSGPLALGITDATPSERGAMTAAQAAKLAGIESGATTDMTPSEILTALKTVDGAGSGLDAELLAGNAASHFATGLGLSSHEADASNPHNVTAAQVGAIETSQKGAPSGVATLDAGGKVPVAQLPATALPEVHVVADAAARLALVVQEGDEAIQLDDGSHWIYDGSAWYSRPFPTIPVSSVFGRVGAIVAAAGDYDAAQVGFTPSGSIAATDVQAAIVEVRDDAASALGVHTADNANPHGVTAAQISAATVADLGMLSDAVVDHITDLGNPHGVTAAQVGAPTVADLSAHTGDTGNPHGVTAAQAGAAPSSHVGAGGSAHALATPSAHGFMSSTDKATVATIQSGTWTPTVSGEVNCAAPAHSIGYWQRVGSYYDLHCLFTVAATASGSVQWDFSLPPGFPAVVSFRQFVGDVVCIDSSGKSRVTADSTKITARYAASVTSVQNAWAWLRVWAD